MVKDTIDLGKVTGVKHQAEHLAEAFGITDERSRTIKQMCVDITDVDDKVISEILCDVATQFKGNELLYAFFLLGELRARSYAMQQSSCMSIGSPEDLSKILDKMLSGKDGDN